MYVIAYDVGTTGVKTCLFEVRDTIRLLAGAYEAYGLYILPGGGAEQDADEWWAAMAKSTRRLLEKTSTDPKAIAGISFCSQMQGLVLVDEAGRALRRPMSYMDQRGGKEFAACQTHGITISGVNALMLLRSLRRTRAASTSVKDPLWKYKWVQKNEPEVYARIHKWLDVKEYLIGRCTGRFVMTRDSAYSTFLYDSRPGKGRWSRELCRMYGVNFDHMPRIIECTDVAGPLTLQAAEELGLAEGCPVYGGGGDATLIGVGELVHYLGDSVALVCAVDQETVEAAKKLVKVEYEVLPAVHNPTEAAAPGAPLVFDEEESNVQAYKHVSRGNAEGAIKNAKYVLTEHFSTPWTEHAFLEPECCVALPLDNGGVKLLTTDQSAHTTMHECASMLGVDYDHCQVQNCLVGGGFGGKEDMSVQHHAALLCYLTKRPVKFKLSRQESILVHPKRHSMDMDFTMGCDENGIIQGVKASVVSDTGAFASLGGPVLERACTHAAGPYAYENFEIEGRAYYTNNPPAGAFRGFGVTQTCFCTETLLNQMADLVGISPWEIRYRNAIRPGGVLPNGQIVDDSTGLVETLEAIKPAYDEAVKNGDPVGIACAMKNAGVGVGIPDWGRCKLIVEDDGKVHIYSGASCIGQGLGTVLVQVVVTNTGLHRDDIVYERSNTWIAPDSGDTSGSRQTLVTGEATRRACEKLKAELDAGKSLADLKGTEFYGEYLAKTDPLGADVPNPVSHVAYGYATQMCILDKETGRIKKMVAAHDVGKAVNPLSVEGQIEGGVVMSMGFALTEKYPIDENCKPTAKYGMLGLFRANQIPPEIQAIVVEKPGLNVAGGAIGIGEITSIPTAPAIADAYYRLTGEREFSLPLKNTPYAPKK